MDIARGSINRPLYTWIIMLAALFGGIWGFLNLGRLEDPAFTIKQAVVITQYPGASAEQVALEVSEPLESAIQKMGEVKQITSMNQPGLSRIDVEMQDTFDGSELPALWTKLRSEVEDAARDLPEGVSTPFVNDGFGDVFGVFYAVTAEGYTDAERHELATFLRRELLAVDGVADVEIAGLPEEAIFVEPKMAITVNQNIPINAVSNALATANSVRSAGQVDNGPVQTRVSAPEGSDSVTEIAGLTIGSQGEVINIIDMADVHRGRVDDPSQIIRFDGVEAFTIGIAGLATENIVEVGQRVDARLAELDSQIPYVLS